MTTASFHNVMKWNLRASVSWWHVLAIIVVFFLLGWYGGLMTVNAARSQNMYANVWQGLVVTFGGPAFTELKLVDMLRWLIGHLLFLYLFGSFIQDELVEMGSTTLLRTGSRSGWWWGKIVALLCLALVYALLGIAAALIGVLIHLPWAWEIGTVETVVPIPEDMVVGSLLSWIFLLFSITLLNIIAFQATLSLVLRSSILSFLASCLVLILSWLFGTNNPELVRWLPGSQSMLLRHSVFQPDLHTFTFEWSLIYSLLFILLSSVLGVWYIQRMDIFGSTHSV